MTNKKKSFDLNSVFLLNLLLIVIVIIFFTILDDSSKKLLAIFLLPILFVLPVLIVVREQKTIKYLVGLIPLVLCMVGVLGVSLAGLKNFLPYPIISESKAIGYEHYFNYPLSLDAFVVYSLLSFPFLAGFLVRVFFKKIKNE